MYLVLCEGVREQERSCSLPVAPRAVGRCIFPAQAPIVQNLWRRPRSMQLDSVSNSLLQAVRKCFTTPAPAQPPNGVQLRHPLSSGPLSGQTQGCRKKGSSDLHMTSSGPLAWVRTDAREVAVPGPPALTPAQRPLRHRALGPAHHLPPAPHLTSRVSARRPEKPGHLRPRTSQNSPLWRLPSRSRPRQVVGCRSVCGSHLDANDWILG